MRDLAAALAGYEAGLQTAAEGLRSAALAAVGAGPWVVETIVDIDVQANNFLSAAGRLRELAATLQRAASTVEAEQAAWAAQVAKAARETSGRSGSG
jgi:hypothetical protein